MTWAEKFHKAFQARTYTQSTIARIARAPRSEFAAWRSRRLAQRMRERWASLAVDKLLRNVDKDRLAQIRARYSNAGDRPDVFWTKYLDVEHWLKSNASHAKRFGLLAKPPRSVLDLGCGGGYFLVVCRQLGARVVGLDLDKDKVLNEMVDVLRLRRVVWEIQAFCPLPRFSRRFDLITAFMICFNYPTGQPAWGPAEWNFFLNDLTPRLRRGGRVILGLNRNLEDGTLYTGEVKAFFEARGALIDGKRVTFHRQSLARTTRLFDRPEPAAAVSAA